MLEAGDFKQAAPIGDDPLHREGASARRRGGDDADGVIKHQDLVRRGVALRGEFQTVVILRNVHRRDDRDDTMTPEARAVDRQEADRFQDVVLRMADGTLGLEDVEWLASRERRRLQCTPEGREELKRFARAPLLMDTRRRRLTGQDGADRMNAIELRRLAVRTGRPIAALRGYHSVPASGEALEPSLLAAEEFQGTAAVLELCEGARVLLTRNLWVEAGLVNGALGVVVGFVWPEGGDPSSENSKLRRAISSASFSTRKKLDPSTISITCLLSVR